MIFQFCRKTGMRGIIALVLIAVVLSVSGCGLAKQDATPEQMIDEFSKLTMASGEKRLGKDYSSYEMGVGYQYVTYKGRNYDEIRLFHDPNDRTRIQDINFIMDYNGNREDIDSLIWALNKKFGTPETGTSVADIGSFDYHYYSDSSGEKVAYVKIYDYGKVEVDYYYANHWAPQQLKLMDLNEKTDIMTALRSIDHYYQIEYIEDMISVNFGKCYMLSDPAGLTEESKFYFNKETKTLKQYYSIVKPFTYPGQDSMGKSLSDLQYYTYLVNIEDAANERWGKATVEAENYYSTGVSYTKSTWKGDGITLRMSNNDEIAFITYNIDAMWE